MNIWNDFFPTIELPTSQARIWEALHTPEVINSAIAQTAVKYSKLGGNMNLTFMIKFASSIMNRLDREGHSRPNNVPSVLVPDAVPDDNIGNRA